tara:strand:- start:45885 stop:46379 length:495 start_codon:yes stop_codon:yes gene_type:complete
MLLSLISFNVNAQETSMKEYEKLSEIAGIENCKNMVEKSFSYFNYLEGSDSFIKSDYLSDKESGFKTVRFYFTFRNQDPFIGDITIMETKQYCQSHIQLSIVDESVSCKEWKNNSPDNWKDLFLKEQVNWATNGKHNVLFQELNSEKGCQFSVFISDMEIIDNQ